jgi:ribosomal protein S18 acetylase RimI-like enzyme
METYLRLATANESSVVFRLMEDYYNEVRSEFHPKKHRWAIERLIANPAVGKLWLVMVGNEVVGYLVLTLGYSLEMGGPDAFIDDFYVVPGARGRGIGGAATKLALEQAAQMGIRAVHLEVDQSNDRARNLYRRLGFHDRDRYQLMTVRLAPDEAGGQ